MSDNFTQDDMTDVAKGVHEQLRAQLKPEFACMVVVVHRGGDVAAAHDVPAAMLSNVLGRIGTMSRDGSAKVLYLPPGLARA